jgi:hypothetical protein
MVRGKNKADVSCMGLKSCETIVLLGVIAQSDGSHEGVAPVLAQPSGAKLQGFSGGAPLD